MSLILILTLDRVFSTTSGSQFFRVVIQTDVEPFSNKDQGWFKLVLTGVPACATMGVVLGVLSVNFINFQANENTQL